MANSVVVTGGAGYIGSHAVKPLRNQGIPVFLSVKAVLDSIARVVGPKVPPTIGPGRPGDPGVRFASSERIRRELGWAPELEDLDAIVDTAWRWRAAHPHGYRKATA